MKHGPDGYELVVPLWRSGHHLFLVSWRSEFISCLWSSAPNCHPFQDKHISDSYIYLYTIFLNNGDIIYSLTTVHLMISRTLSIYKVNVAKN